MPKSSTMAEHGSPCAPRSIHLVSPRHLCFRHPATEVLLRLEPMRFRIYGGCRKVLDLGIHNVPRPPSRPHDRR
ncbi:hypothetical protein MTBSS4_120003 [Magnetospirillum sp. SS-4]|nr:hypothetical protein MTBSS4_120003 [Magnetospirillum sp. SS-4]